MCDLNSYKTDMKIYFIDLLLAVFSFVSIIKIKMYVKERYFKKFLEIIPAIFFNYYYFSSHTEQTYRECFLRKKIVNI